jgi:hypothetical protein
MHSGPSCFGLFTNVHTGNASSSPASYGFMIGPSTFTECSVGSSQSRYFSGGTITGMRSLIGCMRELASR